MNNNKFQAEVKKSFECLLKINSLVQEVSSDPKVLKAVIVEMMNNYDADLENVVDNFFSSVENDLFSIKKDLESTAYSIQQEAKNKE